MAAIEVKGLRAYYLVGSVKNVKTVKAVDGIDLSINEDEIYGIAGESGCGKTTLIKALTGIAKLPLRIVAGEVDFKINGRNVNITELDGKDRANMVRGRSISYIPQGSMSVLNPVRRINKSFQDFVYAHAEVSRGEFKTMVKTHLNGLGLSAEILKAYPHQLSGGMQQRVTIALATILKPPIILADEPSTALDVIMQRSVIQLLKKIKREQRNTFIMITHDMAIHANFSERVGIMYAGKLVEEARTKDIFKANVHPYTNFLIGSLPRIGDKTFRISAPGAPPSLVDPPPGCRFHPRCPKAMDICHEVEPLMQWVGEEHRAACHLVDKETRNAT